MEFVEEYERTEENHIIRDNQNTLPPEMSLEEVIEILSLTIKHDDDNKLITFLCMLSAYTDNSQLNVSFNAPSSSGKTYMTKEVSKLFPKEDKIELSGASPTSFFYGESVYDKKQQAKIVSLERKILLFYEQPNPQLQAKLRPVLSHDDRELNFRMTNKDKKGSQRAEKIIIRGFPATVFCSAGLQLDEQEATRAILLSPEVTEAKLKEGVHLQFLRGANEIEFDDELESQEKRIALKERIVAIRNERVDDILINDPEAIEAKFNTTFGKLKPRHMRDSGHLMRLIKVVTLLNIWHRRTLDGKILASESDIQNAFRLWSSVIESQDKNVPPAVLSFYKNFILPCYFKKEMAFEFADDIRQKLIGITSQELASYYLLREQTTINEEHLRKQMLPQLINAGLIALEQPLKGDKRSKHIFPNYFPNLINNEQNQNNIGIYGGVKDIKGFC